MHEQTEFLEELPNSQRRSAKKSALRLAELDSEDWLGDEEPLTPTRQRYLMRGLPLTQRIQTLVARWKKLRAQSELSVRADHVNRQLMFSTEAAG